jgi:hypothetical protein
MYLLYGWTERHNINQRRCQVAKDTLPTTHASAEPLEQHLDDEYLRGIERRPAMQAHIGGNDEEQQPQIQI